MSEGLLYYLAYGSNLHPVRLRERVPSAELLDVVELRHYRLAFQKRGQDGSSKSNLARTGEEGIYQIDSAHKPILDRIEGKGNGYHDRQLPVGLHGKGYASLTYLAQPSYIENNLKPYHWYQTLVVLGAKYLRFPNAYVRSIESIESLESGRRKPDATSKIDRANSSIFPHNSGH